MQIIHQMTIDMALQLPMVPVSAVQGDGNTRVLAVTLLENGAPWQIPGNAVVDVAFRKPDGTKGIYSRLPDGSSATSRDGNVLSATLAPQMLTCPGAVLATVVFRTDGNKTLAAFPFAVKVEASPAAGAEVSEDYFNPTQLSDLRAEIAAHAGRRDNPHGVTAELVKAANREVLLVPAGGSVTIGLPQAGTFLISACDNVRQGCVLLQTTNNDVFNTSELLPLNKWAYSADGLNLTVSETGGTYGVYVAVVSFGKGYYAG